MNQSWPRKIILQMSTETYKVTMLNTVYCKYGHLKRDPAKHICHICKKESSKKSRELKKQFKVIKNKPPLIEKIYKRIFIDVNKLYNYTLCWNWREREKARVRSREFRAKEREEKKQRG